MDYAKPADVVASMIDVSLKKLTLPPRELLTRGALSGALLGAATSLAFVGGFVFTGFALYATFKPASPGISAPSVLIPQVPAE